MTHLDERVGKREDQRREERFMIKERAMELIAALRSGKYKQGREYLEVEDRNCCLGVACRLMPDLPAEIIRNNDAPLIPTSFGKNFNTELLPLEVALFFRFQDSMGGFYRSRVRWPKSIEKHSAFRKQSSLAELNDSGATFEQIADFIELNWEVL